MPFAKGSKKIAHWTCKQYRNQRQWGNPQGHSRGENIPSWTKSFSFPYSSSILPVFLHHFILLGLHFVSRLHCTLLLAYVLAFRTIEILHIRVSNYQNQWNTFSLIVRHMLFRFINTWSTSTSFLFMKCYISIF